MKVEESTTEKIKENKLGEIIEKEELHYFDKEKFPCYYHALQRDTILNEVFRRVEPNGKTMGEYLRETVNPNFGVNIFTGLTDEELKKRIPFKVMGGWKQFKMMMDGKKNAPIRSSFSEMNAEYEKYNKIQEELKKKGWPEQITSPTSLDYDIEVKGEPFAAFQAVCQTDLFQKMEAPSWNVNASARSMGRLAAFLANKGTLDGKQLIKEETWELMHKDPKKEMMDQFRETKFT